MKNSVTVTPHTERVTDFVCHKGFHLLRGKEIARVSFCKNVYSHLFKDVFVLDYRAGDYRFVFDFVVGIFPVGFTAELNDNLCADFVVHLLERHKLFAFSLPIFKCAYRSRGVIWRNVFVRDDCVGQRERISAPS